MATFAVGQNVKVITRDGTEHFEETGVLIEDMGETIHPYLVKFGNGDVEDFGADELATETEAPTVGGAAVDDSGYSELLDELSGKIKRLERERDGLRDRLVEAVEAFTELLGVVAISKDVSEYDFNVARKALQQMTKTAALAQARQDAGTEGR